MALQFEHFLISEVGKIEKGDGLEQYQKSINDFMKREDITPVEVQRFAIKDTFLTVVSYLELSKTEYEEKQRRRQSSQLIPPGAIPITFPPKK
jgi:hypothetical protein